MASTTPNTPVDLVIRFNTPEITDLTISISSAESTTPLTVKRRIREQLPASVAANRLRLISSGRFLPDTTALSRCITIPAPPPRPKTAQEEAQYKGKGKAPATVPVALAAKVFINCSIGDTLSTDDLAKEATDAEAADAALSSEQTAQSATSANDAGEIGAASSASTSQGPRGFDRLLSAGFSDRDVAEMRANHRAVLANSHTPDTMPTGAALLALEDRWLDNDSNVAGTGAVGAEGEAGTDEEAGGLEDMLWGNAIGFFWPVALLMFAQEANLWSRRRWIAVLSGVLVNLTFGFLRVTS